MNGSEQKLDQNIVKLNPYSAFALEYWIVSCLLPEAILFLSRFLTYTILPSEDSFRIFSSTRKSENFIAISLFILRRSYNNFLNSLHFAHIVFARAQTISE